MILIVVSKVKELVKAGGLRTSAEFINELNSKVGAMVVEAAQKCKADGTRQTLKAEDLTQ